MLKELANEIIETLNESEAKDIRITELENENVYNIILKNRIIIQS